MLRFLVILLTVMTAASLTAKARAASRELLVYVGTYTRGDSEGIYVCRLNLDTGVLSAPRLAANVVNPSFVAIHPTGKYLYCVSEISDFNGKKAGGVTSFTIDRKTGLLTKLNEQPSVGAGPCHLVVDATGKNVLVANYGGGSVAALPIAADGTLREASSFIQHEGSSVNPNRQQGPHAHSINVDGQNRFAVCADLGLDKVLIYRLDADKGVLKANEPAFAKVEPGAGPRHFVFHPNGKFAYVNNELTSSVTAFAYDGKAGALNELQTLSTLPADFSGNNSTAEIRIHPSGKFLYVSNRGHDSIAIYRVDTASGMLTHLGNESTRGRTPRNFNLDPSGTFLLAENQNTHNIEVFRIDQESGLLTHTGHHVTVPNPVCVRFLSAD